MVCFNQIRNLLKKMGFGKLTLITITFHTETKSQNLEAKF
jgi:hypothetical protein